MNQNSAATTAGVSRTGSADERREAGAPSPPLTAAQDTRKRVTAIFGGSIGNLVEWYDWYVYATFSLYFAKAFFPAGDQTAQLLNTAAVFAAGFLIRPIGSWALGRYADRFGRKSALQFSIMLMCTGSLIIAVTPTYASIGSFAAFWLVFARLLQGFSLGGEYGTSATYLAEVATPGRRGFYSSFQYVTLTAGQLIATIILVILQFFLLTPEQLETWGWRIPFLVGALAAVTGLYLRRNLTETDAFMRSNSKSKEAGGIRFLLKHPREIVIVAGMTMGGTVAFYTYSAYMQKYLVNTVGITKQQSTMISFATLCVFVILQPLMGILSDKIGRKPVLIAFGVLGTFGNIPLMMLISKTQDPFVLGCLVLVALTVIAGYTALSAIVKAELFPAEIRSIGVGLPSAIAISIFGGTAEYIALWFKSIGQESGFYWYVSGCIACSLVVFSLMRETSKTSVIEQQRLARAP
jgi:MHS family alpha-ketoglutarate permease-like MFS transporter